MPSPVVMASALSRRTKNARIAILGNAFCLREHPLTLAEEHAMIDCITGGRLISGFVRGVGAEYFSFGANPAISHERLQEAHDLVMQAWTRPGPFAFEGKHYHFEYVNVWPRPFQQPHPPIWCPSHGHVETIEWAAHPDRKYVYLQTYSPLESVARYLNLYRELRSAATATPRAPTRSAGRRRSMSPRPTSRRIDEARAAHRGAVQQLLRKLSEMMFFPPGYMSPESLKNMLSAQALGAAARRHGRDADRAGHHHLRQSGHGAPQLIDTHRWVSRTCACRSSAPCRAISPRRISAGSRATCCRR